MKQLISYHIFLFPFKWDYKEKEVKDIEEITLYDRTKITNFHDLIIQSGWKKDNFEIVDGLTYNEQAYFYDFARDVIHGESVTQSIINRYLFPLFDAENAQFIIEIEKTKQHLSYHLSIDKITLNCYEPGVAVLGFHLANYDTATTPQDILNINDFGRRIYPQFIGQSADSQFDLKVPQQTFLAKKIKLSGVFKQDIEENFQQYSQQAQQPTISTYISHLLGKRFKSSTDTTQKGDMLVSPVIDDRMYVVNWYYNPSLIAQLRQFDPERERYNYQTNDLWQQLLFLNSNAPISQHKTQKQTLIDKHTIAHGIESNTLLGIARYSLVLLSDNQQIKPPSLIYQLKTNYYQMAQLVLVQRASVLRFSEEIAYIAGIQQDDEVILTTRSLYKDYLRFINKIYFREVTAQEAGIEIYDLLQEKMKIEREVKDLDTEIEELHNYTSMLEEKALLEEDRKQNTILNRLSVIGALLLVPTFISGYFGMNMFSDKLEPYGVFDISSVIFGILSITGFAYWYILLLDKKKQVELEQKIGNRMASMPLWERIVLKAAPFLIILIVIGLMLLPLRHIR